MEAKRRALGKGLSALFGDEAENDAAVAASRGPRLIPIELIHPGKYQPRRVFDEDKLNQLADSVRDKGILQPLLVRAHPGIANGFELIAGERRWRAAQKARLHEVPVVVRELSDRDTLEIALVENLQREDLSPLEEAEAYVRLIEEFHHTQEELSRSVGKSRSHVANIMRLLGTTEKVRRYLTEGKITAGHARALVGIERADDLVDEIVDRGLNVRQTEAMVAKTKPNAAPANREPTPLKDADTLLLERELTDTLGLVVKINDRGRSGDIVIRYSTLDQLDGLLKRLK